MRSRLLIASGALVIAIAIGWLAVEGEKPTVDPAPAASPRPVEAPPAAVTLPEPSSEPAAAPPAPVGSPLAARLHAPDLTADDDVENLRQLAGQYFTALQQTPGPPIGDNIDLTRALTGSNPLKLAPLPPDHRAIDATGRIVDRWGTPYHIHARSARVLTIRSAGPDRRLFTDDDLVAGE